MHHPLNIGAVLAIALGILCVTVHAAGARFRVVVEGVALPPARVLSVAVDGDTLTSIDTATVTLAGRPRLELPAAGVSLEIEAVNTRAGGTLFKEILGVEPVIDPSGSAGVMIRGSNRAHRLTRNQQSRIYEHKSDAEIAAGIAQQAGLAFGPSGAEAAIVHDRVFQHLRFARKRWS